MPDQPVLSLPCSRCGSPTQVDEKQGPVCPIHGPVYRGNTAFILDLKPLTLEELRDLGAIVGDDW